MKLSGLKVVDDTHFDITLSASSAIFLTSLVAFVYYPLPKVFFSNPKAFGGDVSHAAGNGPYKLKNFVHDSKIRLVPNSDCKGERKPQNDGINFLVCAGNATDAAFADVQSGNLDAVEKTKTDNYVNNKSDSRIQWRIEESSVYSSFAIPYYLKHFGQDDERKLKRAAVSRAIDRKTIIDKVAKGLGVLPKPYSSVSKLINGSVETIKGNEVLEYNAEIAKELWAKANEISPWDNEAFKLFYNNSGLKEFFDAHANSVKETLGINCIAEGTSDFKTLLHMMSDREVKDGLKDNWTIDYPSIENILASIFKTNIRTNYRGYSSEEFDSLIADAAKQVAVDKANELFTKVQEVLIKDLPSIPIFYGYNTGTFSPKVKNVKYTWRNAPNYLVMTKK
jgi:oligopeptide transport system substrate-binding protein